MRGGGRVREGEGGGGGSVGWRGCGGGGVERVRIFVVAVSGERV